MAYIKNEKTIWKLVLFLLLFQTLGIYAAPQDYEDQESHLASAEELNLIYASLPHRPEDKFIVLNSHRATNTVKYYLLEMSPKDGTPSYLIVSTSQYGVVVYYKGQKTPFADGSEPLWIQPIAQEILDSLAKSKVSKK